jgi:hypothetical protein
MTVTASCRDTVWEITFILVLLTIISSSFSDDCDQDKSTSLPECMSGVSCYSPLCKRLYRFLHTQAHHYYIYRMGHKSLTTLCKSQSMRNRWITTICDLVRTRGKSIYIMAFKSPHFFILGQLFREFKSFSYFVPLATVCTVWSPRET